MSQMTEKEMKLAQSLIHPPGDATGAKPDKDKDLYKMSSKDDDYFKKMSETEQVRLYTSLHDHNAKLRESIRSLKKELITLLQKNESFEQLNINDLAKENKELREELLALTMKADKVCSSYPGSKQQSLRPS